jgi:hypothetical protein
MNEPKPKSWLSLELRCGCGASLFVEVPQEPSYGTHLLTAEVTKLGQLWTQAHAAHHQEPKK